MRLLLSLPCLAAFAGLRALAAPSYDNTQRSDIVPKDLASTILGEIESAATCAGCDVVLVALKGLAFFGDSAFISVVTEICVLSKAEDADVCKGTIAAEGPILAHDLRGLSVGSHTSQLICATLFGLCSFPAVTPHTVSFPSPKPATPRPAPSGKTPIQVVHISDTHVDLSYETGANYNCTKPICCRAYTSADAPGNNNFPAGPFGNTQCDPPLTLEQSMFAAIESLPSVAFTIFTGDVVAHDIWLVNENEVQTDLNTTYADMHGLKQVYPALGNHDTAPVNAFPPAAVSAAVTAEWAYDTMSADWLSWIGSDAVNTVDELGSYSVLYPGTKLRVISFNSVFYYTLNFWMYEEPMEIDPSGQFAWLVNELQAAETAGERVWLISHVPSGNGDFFHDYSNYFDQIVQRYEATISGLFYGHTHRDEFQIAYSDYTKPSFDNAVAVSYIAPSMTPTSGHPSFRVYSVDPDTFAVLDFTEYIANISSPTFQTNPTWEKYYSAKETYGPLVSPPLTDPAAELTAAFWHNVTTVFDSDDAQFQEYYSRKSRGYSTATCTGTCKTSELCQIRAAQSQYNCQVPTPGIHFSKRDGAATEHHDDCEGTAIRGIFWKLAQDPKVFANQVNGEVAKMS